MAKLTGTDAHRERVLRAAVTLLTKSGRDAVTTRSVAEAAKVQPPVLYRLFGDKEGLLEAVAVYGFLKYLAKKEPPALCTDPVEGLRRGWDMHVDFGLANPELYLLMYAKSGPVVDSPAALHARGLLKQHMQHVAAAGRLRESLERACDLYHAAAVGVVLSLLAKTPEERDMAISPTMRDLVLTHITVARSRASNEGDSIAVAANHLHALFITSRDTQRVLSQAEESLLGEWLQRLAKHKS